jgi:hypothetical protein
MTIVRSLRCEWIGTLAQLFSLKSAGHWLWVGQPRPQNPPT